MIQAIYKQKRHFIIRSLFFQTLQQNLKKHLQLLVSVQQLGCSSQPNFVFLTYNELQQLLTIS
ncbi:hypothetical protein COI63_16390 [Bacillus toyonensis]|nr:hypothetical protein COI63_16390 [Bacillus toyonensis]